MQYSEMQADAKIKIILSPPLGNQGRGALPTFVLMLPVNTPAPDFSLPDQYGGMYHLREHIGQKMIVLYFYPKDNTRGCTVEACTFRDYYEDFLELDCEVVGVSGDSVASHRRFAEKHRLPFLLLSDKGNQVRRLYQAQGPVFGLIPGRITYLIDKKGIIIHAFNSMMQFERHVQDTISAIKFPRSAG